MRLNTIHNLYFYQDFFQKMREAIETGLLEMFKTRWQALFLRKEE